MLSQIRIDYKEFAKARHLMMCKIAENVQHAESIGDAGKRVITFDIVAYVKGEVVKTTNKIVEIADETGDGALYSAVMLAYDAVFTFINTRVSEQRTLSENDAISILAICMFIAEQTNRYKTVRYLADIVFALNNDCIEETIRIETEDPYI